MRIAAPPALAAALLATALVCGCSKETPAPSRAAGISGQPAGRIGLGEADSIVGGVKLVLLELRRDEGETLFVRWQYRNDANLKVAMQPLNFAGMDAHRLAYGLAIADSAGSKYALLDASSPVAAAEKRDDFTFSAHFAPHQVVETWARVKAPPVAVERVDVFLPTAAPIRNVPIAGRK